MKQGLVVVLCIVLACAFVSVCDAYCDASDCVSCTNLPIGPSLSCHWCPGSGCYNWFDNPNSCSNDIALSMACPASSSGGSSSSGSNGGGSSYTDIGDSDMTLALTFITINFITLIVAMIVWCCRKCAVQPIVDLHQHRMNVMDFSAFPDGESIQRKVQESGGPGVIWSDVSIRVAKVSELVKLIILQIVVIVMSLFLPMFSLIFAPVLIVASIPCLIVAFTGLKQLIGKDHYSAIYYLDSHGATIMRKKMCGGITIGHWDYCKMHNIHVTASSQGTGNVFFSKQWRLQQSVNNNVRRGERYSHTTSNGTRMVWRRVAIGFENIIRYSEVECTVRNNYERAVICVPQPTVFVAPVVAAPVVVAAPMMFAAPAPAPAPVINNINIVQHSAPQQPQQQQQQQQPQQQQQQPFFDQQSMMQQQQQQQQPMMQQQQPMQQQPMMQQQQPMQQQQYNQQPQYNQQQQYNQQPQQQQQQYNQQPQQQQQQYNQQPQQQQQYNQQQQQQYNQQPQQQQQQQYNQQPQYMQQPTAPVVQQGDQQQQQQQQPPPNQTNYQPDFDTKK